MKPRVIYFKYTKLLKMAKDRGISGYLFVNPEQDEFIRCEYIQNTDLGLLEDILIGSGLARPVVTKDFMIELSRGDVTENFINQSLILKRQFIH